MKMISMDFGWLENSACVFDSISSEQGPIVHVYVCVYVLEFRSLHLPFAPWNSVNLKYFWNRHCVNSFGLRCFRNARTSARTFSKDSMVEWIVYRYSHKTTAKCLLYSCAHPFSGVAWESLSCWPKTITLIITAITVTTKIKSKSKSNTNSNRNRNNNAIAGPCMRSSLQTAKTWF